MADKQVFNHQVRQTALITVALVFALVFGISLLASGDWIPGAIIALVTVAGLSLQTRVIVRLCREGATSSAPRSKH